MKNAKLVIILYALRQFSFSKGVFSLFFFDKGFSIGELAIYFTAMRLSQTVLEIPSGMIADKFGRRRSLQISRVLFLIALLLLIFSQNITFVILAALLEGVCNALYSDSDVSLVYDELNKEEKSHLYPKFIAMYDGIGFVALSVASVIGASVASVAPLVVTLIMKIPIIITHFFLSRKLVDGVSDGRLKPKSIETRHLKESWRYVTKNRDIMKIIYFSAVIFAFNVMIWDYYQAYGVAINMPIGMFGWVVVGFSIAEGLPQFMSYKYVRPKNFEILYVTLITMSALFGIASALLGNVTGFIFLILSVVVNGFSFPVSAAIIHKHADTKHRTTIASFGTLFGMLLYSLYGLFFGVIAEDYGVFAAFGFVSLATFVAASVYLFLHFVRPFLKKHKTLAHALHIPEALVEKPEHEHQPGKGHRQVYRHKSRWQY